MRLGNRYSLAPIREREKTYTFDSDQEGWDHSWEGEATSGSSVKSAGHDSGEGNPSGSLHQSRNAACGSLNSCFTVGASVWNRTITVKELGIHEGTRIRRVGLESDFKLTVASQGSNDNILQDPFIRAIVGGESRDRQKFQQLNSDTDWSDKHTLTTFALGTSNELDFTDADARIGASGLSFRFDIFIDCNSPIGSGNRHVNMWWDNVTIVVETEDERVIRVRL